MEGQGPGGLSGTLDSEGKPAGETGLGRLENLGVG